jgi:predicted transglutaminase-like cysteine proteinase
MQGCLEACLDQEPFVAGDYQYSMDRLYQREGLPRSSVPWKSVDIGEVDQIVQQARLDLPYASDDETWGREYWATTEESLAMGAGDCEDIALLILVRLLEAGYSPDQLALGVVWNCTQFHVIALIRDWQGEWAVDDGNVFFATTPYDWDNTLTWRSPSG